MGEDTPCLAFQVRDHVLVTHVEDASFRQHAVPMRHQRAGSGVIAAELGEIVGMALLGGNSLEKQDMQVSTGSRTAWMITRIRQREMNQPGEE